MPRLKTDSEVATMKYLRERTDIPVPTIYHHDSNPYNRLGGEYIIMSKVLSILPSFFLYSRNGDINLCSIIILHVIGFL